MRIAQEEIFGPVVSVIPCDGLDDGDRRSPTASPTACPAPSTPATSTPRSPRCATSRSGLFYVNAPTIGAEVHLPFGGIKATGNGHREAGIAALDVFSEWKSIYVDFSGRLQRAQMDT